MANRALPSLKARFLDKQAIEQLIAEQNAQIGFVPDPTATGEKAQELMRAQGIRPEENIGSCGIIAARDEA